MSEFTSLVFRDEEQASREGMVWDTTYGGVTTWDGRAVSAKVFIMTPEKFGWNVMTFLDGYFHSVDDQPAMVDMWDFQSGNLDQARERRWLANGYPHRETGPAFVNENGVQFWLRGKHLAFEKWLDRIDADLATKVMLKLTWG